jgi:hypothetical protein
MRFTRPLRVAAVLLIAFLALALPATAAVAQSYPSTPTLTVNKPVVAPCGTVVLTGTGFLPDSLVTITVDGTVIGTVMSDGNGDYTFNYTVPCSAVDGEVLTFTGNDGTNILSVTVTVEISAVTTTTAGSLPKTGVSDTTMLLVRVSVVLVAVGGILVLATARRRRSHTSS